MNDKLIVIVGFMGSGKTAVGQELSHLLDKRFDDLDERIEKFEGRSPAEIIREDGEQRFREIETAALRKLLDQPAVVALGGGAWPIAANRELIRSGESIVVWLDAPFDVCWDRIQRDTELRPMASSRGAAERLYSDRLPFYQLADVRVAGSDHSAVEIAEHIAALLQQQSHT